MQSIDKRRAQRYRRGTVFDNLERDFKY